MGSGEEQRGGRRRDPEEIEMKRRRRRRRRFIFRPFRQEYELENIKFLLREGRGSRLS